MKRIVALVLVIGFLLVPALRAEELLFFGNSFTYYNDMPKMVEAIAASKRRVAATTAVTKGGQGFSYHLAQPATDAALKRKAWDWVVLQDHSLNATRAAKTTDELMKYGLLLHDRITTESPKSNIVLYETWAFSAKHEFFKGRFSGPDEMLGEIRKNYATLGARMQAKGPNRSVVVAPVGGAFARSVAEHPEINLYANDEKHPSVAGSYLAACVIYATVFGDSPVGAAAANKLGPREAGLLQRIAAETVRTLQAGK